MRHSTANGPVAEDVANGATAAADNRAGEPTTTLNGSGVGGGDWLAGLSQENRSLVEAKKWDAPDAMLKSYRDLEAHASKALVPPGKDATQQDWDAFYSKMGRPKTPEGYRFDLPTGVPDDMPYDDTLKTQFQVWAHEAGLTPKQAATMHDKYVQQAGQTYSQAVDDTTAKVGSAHDDLVKAWGDPGSKTYQRNVELADRAVRQLGGEELRDELKQFGFMTDKGEVASARLTQMLARVGEQLYAEDTVFAGPTASTNPFAEGPHHNLTEQGRIMRNDPKRARALIQSAGLNPSDFRL